MLGDFNLDGHLDVATADFGLDGTLGKSVSVLLGNGDGTFQPRLRFLVGGAPNSIVTDDLNGDGAPDLVVGEDSRFVALLGDGAGGFSLSSSIRVPALSDGVALGDFDGDGLLDVVIGNSDLSFNTRPASVAATATAPFGPPPSSTSTSHAPAWRM